MSSTVLRLQLAREIPKSHTGIRGDLFIYHLFHTSLVQGADQHRMGMGTKRIIGPKRGAKPSAYERYTLGVALAVEGYISSRENNWTERETPSLAIGICECHQRYF